MSKRANGEGTIYKMENRNLWCGQISVNDPKTGKLKRKVVYGKTQKIVREKIHNLKEQKIGGINLTAEVESIEKILEEAIEYQYNTNVLSDVAYLRKKESFKILKKYHFVVNKPINKITNFELTEFLKSITSYSNSVISKVYGLLNFAFKQAIFKGYINQNPLDNKQQFKRPISSKKNKKVTAFTLSEQKDFVSALLASNTVRYKEQMLLSLYTGALIL